MAPLVDYPDTDDLDDETRELLERTRTEHGEIPSFTRLLATNPAVFEAALGQFGEVVYGADLEVPLKQLAFVVVSLENECAYCAATHGDELVNAFGHPGDRLDALAAADYADLSDRERAVAEFARQAATDPKRISEDHVDALRSVGFDDAGVVELLTVVAQATFANTIADAMDLDPSQQRPDLVEYYPMETPISE